MVGSILSEINSTYGKYYVFGNHDSSIKVNDDVRDISSTGLFALLDNEVH